jgi:hypothetical protein
MDELLNDESLGTASIQPAMAAEASARVSAIIISGIAFRPNPPGLHEGYSDS